MRTNQELLNQFPVASNALASMVSFQREGLTNLSELNNRWAFYKGVIFTLHLCHLINHPEFSILFTNGHDCYRELLDILDPVPF